MNITLRKFAGLIGYSPATVSKAFSGATDIKPETRSKIFTLAEEMGVLECFYKSPKNHKTVAVILPEFNSGLYVNIMSLLSDYLFRKSAVAVFSEDGFSEERCEKLIKYYSSDKISDGIIIFGSARSAKKYSSVPIMYSSAKSDPFADSVYPEFFTGICEVIFNFKISGHKKIAFIGEKNTVSKEKNFRKAMKYYNLPVTEDYVIRSDLRHEAAGYKSMKKLLSLPERPTAILAAYDDIAIGAMRCAKAEGLSAPQDYSIAGMDNSDIAANDSIMLSSVDNHIDVMCRLLVDRLMQKTDNPSMCVIQKTEVKSSLVLRKTMGPNPETSNPQ